MVYYELYRNGPKCMACATTQSGDATRAGKHLMRFSRRYNKYHKQTDRKHNWLSIKQKALSQNLCLRNGMIDTP